MAEWDQYSDYLHLDKLLNAQERRSDDTNTPESANHDEMLFIIFHQSYELWFKQILFEFDDIQSRFSSDMMNDRDLSTIISQLERIVLILNSIVHQMSILETMHPQSFVDFREKLQTASGFQSWQFRLIEIRLGLARKDRLKFNHATYDAQMNSKHTGLFKAAESTPTIHSQLDAWLCRMPFGQEKSNQHSFWQETDTRYSFWQDYKNSVHTLFDARLKVIEQDHSAGKITDEAFEKERIGITRGREKFEAIFDENTHKTMVEEGHWRLSLPALQSALFIHIYRDEPVLHMPFKLLDRLMDIDSLLSKWRYAHALMVQRMVGFSMGSGGSSGYRYLMQTLEKHRIFNDLFTLSGYLIPSHAQPPLPENLKQNMGYSYNKVDI